MKRWIPTGIGALCAAVLYFGIPVPPSDAQRDRGDRNSDGTWPCVRSNADGGGEMRYETGYISSSYTGAICAAFNTLEDLLGFTLPEAQAAFSFPEPVQTCSDGKQYLSDPDCSEVGSGTDFAWTGSIPDFLNRSADSMDTIDYDLEQHCTGTDCGSVVYSLVNVAGDDCSGGFGWSVNTGDGSSDLENDASTAGSGTCQIQLAFSGDTVLSADAVFDWSYQSDSGTDSTAPIPPKNVTLSQNATDTSHVDVAFDPGADTWESAADPTGLKEYNIWRGASGGSLAVIDTVAFGPGLSPQMTEGDIGTVSPAGSSTYHGGGDWQCVSEGQIGELASNGPDAFRFIRTSVSGDWIAWAQVESFSGGASNFRKAGIHARVDTADDARFFEVTARSNGTLRLSRRTVKGGDGTVSGSVSDITFPHWVSLEFDASTDTITASHTSDGQDPIVIDQVSFEMPGSLLVGLPCASTEDGVQTTVEYNDFFIDNLGRTTYTDSTASASTAYDYQVDVSDNADNDSAVSPSSALSITTGSGGAGGTAKKWTPGDYVKTQGKTCQSDQQSYKDSVRNQLGLINNSAEFEGAWVSAAWGQIETGPDTFDWSIIDDWLAGLPTGGKLIIAFEYKCFGTTGASAIDVLVPSDLESDVDTFDGGGGGIVASIWKESVMDRMIAFDQQAAARYDSDARVELIGTGSESCPSWAGNPPADWDANAWNTQLQRLWGSQVSEWLETNVVGVWNCDVDGHGDNHLEFMYDNGLGMRSPDSHDDSGNRLFKGELDAVRDYGGLIPHQTVVSAPNLGGFDDILPLSNIETLLNAGTMTHVAWVLSSGSSGGTSSDIISHLEADPANGADPSQACPSQYAGGCQ